MNVKMLVATVVACCFLTPQAHADEGTFDSNGVKIRYSIEGEGEPVVLVHGWMGDSSMWGRDKTGNTKLNPIEGFQAIALDCRGHGKSDKPHEKEKYGAEMAEDIVRLLDHLKIKKAHLIGYSMGTFLVARVAATHPDRVLSLIYGGQAPLISGPAWTDANEVTVFAKAVADGKGLGPYIQEVMPADKKPTLDQANAYAKIMFGNKDVQAFAAAGLSFRDLRVSKDDLKKCDVPTLFIHGANDPSRDRIASVQKQLGRGEVKIVAGGDHMTTLTKPEFGSTIVEFLRAHKSKKF